MSFPRHPRFRATRRLLIGLAVLLLAWLARAGEPSVVETNEGRRYHECRDFRLEGGKLSFLHAGGRSELPVASLTRLPEAAQKVVGQAEERRFLREVARSEGIVAFLAAHDEVRRLEQEAKASPAAVAERITFTVVEQIDPRSAGFNPEREGGEIYRVQINDGSANGPQALLETLGERVFTSTQQKLPVHYVRKVSLQKIGLPATIVPLFREVSGLADAEAEQRAFALAGARERLDAAARRVHPGLDCAACTNGACSGCNGTRRQPCAACKGTRFLPAQPKFEPCRACRGKGGFDRISGSATCRTCNGAGKVPAGSVADPCAACSGTGAAACAVCKGSGQCPVCTGRGRRPPDAISDDDIRLLRESLQKSGDAK